MRHSYKIWYSFLVWLFSMAGALVFGNKIYAQKSKKELSHISSHHKAEIKINDSTWMSLSVHNRACKSGDFFFQLNDFQNANTVADKNTELIERERNDFIHGDVTYDYFYRSAIDTPFSESNIQQHNVRANIRVLVAKQYPVVLQINSRQTNSYLFRSYTDVNLQFDNRSYNTAARDKLAKEIIQKIQASAQDSFLLKAVNTNQRLQDASRQWLEEPRQLQQLVESKQILFAAEEQMKAHATGIEDGLENKIQDSASAKSGQLQSGQLAQQAAKMRNVLSSAKVNPATALQQYLDKNANIQKQKLVDSIFYKVEKAAKVIDAYKAKKEEYNRYKKKADSLQEACKAAKEKTAKKIDDVKGTFANGGSAEINKKVKEYKLDSSGIFKWYKRINAVQQFSVGRSLVDYSELSAKNISITGVQAAYQNKIYVAFATGGVDYRYRDFIARDYTPVKQWLNILRLGIGAQDWHNLIFTVYQGKKQANYFLASNQPGINKVFGITLQGKFRLNENNYLIAEAAKSSYPQISNTGAGSNINTNTKIFNFSNHSNEAYSVQLFSRIAGTDTRIYGQYKYLGRNFQSFSLFNVSSDFTAWQVRIDQYLFRKRLSISAGMRTNDYSNPYLTAAFKSNAIFKSLQATLRLKKWPVLSVGYMPSSQVTSINNQVIENRFYTLTASGNYVYRTRNGFMNTGVMYSKFYNTVPDTAFFYYNARNWYIYHTITHNSLSFNSSVTLSYNNTYNLVTIDQGMNAGLGKQVSAGGGVKWNRLNSIENHIGYYGNVQFRLAKLGEFNLSFDRGFIPGITEKLRKNDFGRATYIKTF